MVSIHHVVIIAYLGALYINLSMGMIYIF